MTNGGHTDVGFWV